jgi:hypothetical protein
MLGMKPIIQSIILIEYIASHAVNIVDRHISNVLTGNILWKFSTYPSIKFEASIKASGIIKSIPDNKKLIKFSTLPAIV